jgi:L-threonylcarbamoyladenylate synthase
VHALDAAAVLRLFAAKGRPSTDPLIVHVASIEAAGPLVTGASSAARQLAARFWPGPLTLVLPRSAVVPDEVTAGLDTVAIRVPAHPVARALLDACAIPVAAPSANLFSRPSPTSASHVLQDLDGRIDLVIDSGPTAIGVESTVLDLSGDVPTILRPGAVSAAMLQAVLPAVRVFVAGAAGSSRAMPSPGMLEKHYSPRAQMVLYEGYGPRAVTRIAADARSAEATGTRVGILAAVDDRGILNLQAPGITIVEVGSVNDLERVAALLYAGLRELDQAGVDLILTHTFPARPGLGDAIQDRLRRAAVRVVRAES